VSMAELAPVLPLRVPVVDEDELSRLRRALDLPRLIEAGYEQCAEVIRPPADHPVLGYGLCPVAGCMAALVAGRLCYGCRQRFRRFDGSFEQFIAIPRVFALSRRGEERLCIVCRTAGHERPAAGRNGLCLSCDSSRRTRGQTVAEYAASAVPRPSYGRCARCERWAAFNAPRLCAACRSHWVWLGRPALEEFAAIPLRRSRAASRGIEVELAALPERLRLEILYAFQVTWLDGGYVWEGTRRLQGLVDALARCGAGSLLEHPSVGGQMVAVLYRRLRAPVERLLADADGELEQDVWRLGMLRPDVGGRTIDYTAVTQPWLRELVKQWNRQRLVSHSVGLLRLDAQVAIELSKLLGLRADGGEDPSLLARQDVVDVVVHLRARQLRGEITNAYQRNCVTRLRAMLRDARERGLHRRPGPLAGLAEEFALVDADVPRKLARDVEGEPERALPQAVIDQLLAPEAIALLRERAGEVTACAIELQMRTGRRPQEIAHAPFSCLEHEQRVREDGRLESLPVFVYRPEKRPKTRKELPVFVEERRLIRRMQALARERFPDADPGRLPLLPRYKCNREGRRPFEPAMLAAKMREWIGGLSAEAEVDGLERWARQAALPSQEEIDRVRFLIGRIREAMGELEPEERVELGALLCTERINRSAILERLPSRHELSVLNVGATFDGVAG